MVSEPIVLSSAKLDERSVALRGMAVDALEGGSRGHVGSTFSLIEILRVLFDEVMTFDPQKPRMVERDRLILSKGHGCIALYILLADKGFFPEEELVSFCRYSSILGGHPEYGHIPGVEASTGSLGHGLAIGVGMAYAARLSNSAHHVFVVMGDGEMDEGSVWESALAAGHHRMDNLTVVVDYNKLQSFGPVVDVWDLEPMTAKWSAFGFDCIEVDGHDTSQLETSLRLPNRTGRPRAVIAHTIKGRGVPFAEGNPFWHHKANLKIEDVAELRAALRNA